MLKSFLLNSRNASKDSYIWNMIGSLLMAFQSVILLMILTRTVGLYESGVFTIAFANANLFMNIGKYGMRNFQVSDINKEFTFQEYLSSRWITTFAMLIVSFIYIVYSSKTNDYSIEKTQIILWMCIFKSADAFEDIYFGDYQKKGRLDVASKALTLRAIFTILLFSVLIILTKNLLLSLVISTCFTLLLMTVFILWTVPSFLETEKTKKTDVTDVLRLLKICFPVFFSSFLSFYIGNAPKYAIDAQLSDELQACYGFIAMPVFVIGLLNSFIFNPIILHLSSLWNDNKRRDFLKEIAIQMGIIFLITSICILGAFAIGIPVLSFLYNTDLSSFKVELIILLLGGGFLALSGILNTVITIIRFQNALVVGYAVTSVLALLLSDKVVSQYSITGATILYASLMAFLCICFTFILFIGIQKSASVNEESK